MFRRLFLVLGVLLVAASSSRAQDGAQTDAEFLPAPAPAPSAAPDFDPAPAPEAAPDFDAAPDFNPAPAPAPASDFEPAPAPAPEPQSYPDLSSSSRAGKMEGTSQVNDRARAAALAALLQSVHKHGGLPEEYRDPAFEQYVDIRLLHTVRQTLDCALLTDLAIQFAKGEDALLRSHKLVAADPLFRLAADWAQKKGDKVTLQRLQSAAERFGKKTVVEYVANQEKLASESRSVIPDFGVPLDSVTPHQYSELQTILLSFQDAQMLKDQATIDALKAKLESNSFTEKQRKRFELIMGSSRADGSATAKEDQATADVLNMLGADSRVDPREERRRLIAAGVLQIIAGALIQSNGGGFPPQGGGFPPPGGGFPPPGGGFPPPGGGFPPPGGGFPPPGGGFPPPGGGFPPPGGGLPPNNGGSGFPPDNGGGGLPPNNGGGVQPPSGGGGGGDVGGFGLTGQQRVFLDRNRGQFIRVR